MPGWSRLPSRDHRMHTTRSKLDDSGIWTWKSPRVVRIGSCSQKYPSSFTRPPNHASTRSITRYATSRSRPTSPDELMKIRKDFALIWFLSLLPESLNDHAQL